MIKTIAKTFLEILILTLFCVAVFFLSGRFALWEKLISLIDKNKDLRFDIAASTILISGIIVFIFYLNKLKVSLKAEGKIIKLRRELKALHEIFPVCPACRRIHSEAFLKQNVEKYLTKYKNRLSKLALCRQCSKTQYQNDESDQ
ncbi:MAG: hypothetical protein PHV17_07570 [Candidatus Omnitrophica bacterium]|nr:hypothetical protein [Candidatus Omnitrophota bacterium]